VERPPHSRGPNPDRAWSKVPGSNCNPVRHPGIAIGS
jgi:hypothetical protein